MAEPEQCVCGGEAGVVNSGVAGGSVADRVSVSVIVPMYNAAGWLPACLESVLCQDYDGTLELSVYDDSSTDASMDVVSAWRARLEHRGMLVTVTQGPPQASPRGVGYAKNGAVAASRGDMLCFLDADDIMAPCRVSLQYVTAAQHRDAIVGCRFSRDPPESTQRYTKWANSLTAAQLYTQVYTAHGPTVVMPTWFCAREVFTKVGGFSEAGRGTPEDLIFFYEHLRLGGAVLRVDHDLLVYRYHEQATTFSISEHTIWSLRMAAFQDRVLKHWDTFTIWNAGKQGRHFYRSLSSHNQLKVTNFCDVDVKKISKGFYTYEESTTKPKPKVPIIHFSEATPPIVICVKQDLTAGGFESNLASLNLKEGVDYYFFS